MTASDQPGRNIELKATDPDPARSMEICRELGAEDNGVIHQRDTYFRVAGGGLKLREETPGRPHLIQFERPDAPQERQSSYRIVGLDDGPTLRAALEAVAPPESDLSAEHRLVAELRAAFAVTDDRLCATGYASQLGL